MHPACSHHRRRHQREPKKWNQACDYAINWILLDAGMTLPDGYLYLEEYRGKSAETVYEILQQGEGDEQSGETEQDVNEEDDSAREDQEEQEEEQEETAQPGDEGDGTGEDGENELAANSDPGLSGEIRDGQEGTSAGKGTENETDWDEALIQAAINARGMGKLPAGLELFIENRLNPKLCWQELLSRFIERSARSDYSWLSPNRRYLHQGLYLPSLKNSELSEIVIAVDSSASIDPAKLSRFAAEISGIMEQYPAIVHLLYCDTRVVRYEVFQRCDLPIEINPKGGGGTDYRPAAGCFHGMGANLVI